MKIPGYLFNIIVIIIQNATLKLMERFVFFIIALALAFGVGYMGSKRKIGFGIAFFISLINVIIGLIAVLCSPRIENNENN